MTTVRQPQQLELVNRDTGLSLLNSVKTQLFGLLLFYVGFLVTFPAETIRFTQSPVLFLIEGSLTIQQWLLLSFLSLVSVSIHEWIHHWFFRYYGHDPEYRRWNTCVVVTDEYISKSALSTVKIAPVTILSATLYIGFILSVVFASGFITILFGYLFALNLSLGTHDIVGWVTMRSANWDYAYAFDSDDGVHTELYRELL